MAELVFQEAVLDPCFLKLSVAGVEVALEGVCAFPSREELASVVGRCCGTGGADAAYGARVVVAGVHAAEMWGGEHGLGVTSFGKSFDLLPLNKSA